MTPKKILCIGNNTVDTDIKTSNLAKRDNVISYGLLTELNDDTIPENILPGYYHSSIYDIEYNHLKTLAKRFDSIVILDQPREQYSHPDAFYQTIRLANELSLICSVIFIDPTYSRSINFFEELVTTNKSFCIFPFIEMLANNGSTNVCCRSSTEITKLSELKDFYTDKNYIKIRNKMLTGELIPEHCSYCYKLENQGILSARKQETVEWANRLGITSLADLNNIKHPAYYEVRPSNICNLQCRSCSPESSHLIKQEYTKLKFINKDFPNLEYTNFDFINFTNLNKLYVAGGEPTAMIEFYEFLDQCINNKKTNFELLINTNGTKLSNRFKEQLTHFNTVSFIVSVDGYNNLNHYIRWPSNWQKIIDNTTYLYNNYSVSFNITVSIYNILTLDKLIAFLNNTFPKAIVHCQFAESPNDRLSALNFPYPELLVNRLITIKDLNFYKNDRLLSSFIDGIINHYSQLYSVDLKRLQLFFDFNDALDASRDIKLIDYIPELALARTLLTPSDGQE